MTNLGPAGVPFLEAENHGGPRTVPISLVVLHSMESAEGHGTAWNVAKWFAGQAASPAPMASAHYCIDAEDVVQCVHEAEVAYHAPGANQNGIGVEHAGRANQTAEQWADEYSHATLLRSIDLVAGICRRYSIPAVIVTAPELQRGVRGITTHAAVSQAFHKSNHTDPGSSFPLAWYVERVAARLVEGA